MTREERELSTIYLEGIKEKYIEGEGYERHPLPEWYALDIAIKALKQEPVLDKIRNELLSMECMEEAVEVVDKYRLEIPFDGRDEE